MPNFTTGPATLPDVGELSYNGCTFSPLFETSVSGKVVQDAANRTTKLMEYTITVDGYVTLVDNSSNIESTTETMRKRLTAQAGDLVYRGRCTKLTVNGTGAVKDVAWGPVPQLLEFQPLGGGLSAKVTWKVTTRIVEVTQKNTVIGPPILQFNEETAVTYDEAGYSTLSITGTLEIPLTRQGQLTIDVPTTADDFRERYIRSVMASIDLTRFRISRRNFQLSRDKRTLEFDIEARELPYMGLPPSVTIARGTFTFRPAKSGMGLCNWLCTLRATYNVRKDQPRRAAWTAFLALLRLRMLASRDANAPEQGQNNATPGPLLQLAAFAVSPTAFNIGGWFGSNVAQRTLQLESKGVDNARRAFLIDFSGEEGLYLDSETVTFSATWRLLTTFSHILVASGLWTKVPTDGGNTWKASVQDIMGPYSWLRDTMQGDVIIDFGR